MSWPVQVWVPIKVVFSIIFVCVRSALVPCTDITLKKNDNKPSSSQFSHCSKRGLIILHVYFFFFFQENVILGSDYPFPLGEHHPGKLIEDVYKDDLELRVREQSHSVSQFVFFLPLIRRRRRRRCLNSLLLWSRNFATMVTGDMSRIDLVSKNLLANFLRNCRKRNNWEKIMSENHLQISQKSQK